MTAHFPRPATRAAALSALNAFLPYAGRAYAAERNYDLGPEDRHNISCLSPYIRLRLLTEEEVIRAVLARHSFVDAEKFVQEVFWRTYWKGWLEMRPSIWRDWTADLTQLDADAANIRMATEGRTGIDCFDSWARELVDTGYLHNHARMWFASIWIFTLGLPWQLGAAFFLRHLLDGDPASNTLSWRWVAGLQTLGKTYLATPENIATFTKGRFQPGPLAHGPGPQPVPAPPPSALPDVDASPAGPTLLLLTQEDLHAETLPLGKAEIVGIAALPARDADVSDLVADFRAAALADGLQRAAAHLGAPILTGDALALAHQLGVSQIVTAYAPIGPIADQLTALAEAGSAEGLTLHRIRRDWDTAAWPHATKGFFPFREKIPTLLPR
jgi:deoxyribodipyrimidine photo-lyase